MPLTDEGAARADRARHFLRKLGTFSESPVQCEKCGRRGRVRRVPGWNTQVIHYCPGPYRLHGFEQIASYEAKR